MSLRLLHSDSELHRRLSPTHPVGNLVFEMLEQFRVEALASPRMPGMVSNLRNRHVAWMLGFHHAGHTETSRGILLFTVIAICRSRVTREPVPEGTEDLLETTRGSIVPVLGFDLVGLRQHRFDQEAYARHALAIALAVAALVDSADEEEGVADPGESPADRSRLPLFLETTGDSRESEGTAGSGRSRALAKDMQQYQTFTTDYDREDLVSTLVRPALLRANRLLLDQKIAQLGVSVPRLARELRMLLSDPARNGWDGAQEQGHIDGRRLTQLIVSPTERRLFQAERTEPVASCRVTFLVDCSGSMKEHAETVAMLVDVFARALDLAGVTNEVLGFTTRTWNGGRALRDWRRSGRPRHPGRLNELSHLVFKDADASWRQARPGIAGLLQPELFREGVDGEAVTWACGRMEGSDEHRRLLIVLSDGSPMDSATNLANDPYYLDNHLKEVVMREESAGSVQIFGLGLGLDLSPYYSRSHALDVSHGVRYELFREVVALLAGRGMGRR